MPYAGEVDICPCLSITFQDKLHLMETMKSVVKKEPHAKYETFYNNMICHGGGAPWNFVGHGCSFTSHPLATVQIFTKLVIDQETQGLHTVSNYLFEISQENDWQKLCSGMKTPRMCPFNDTGNWIRQFFEEAGSNFSGCRENRYISQFTCLRQTLERDSKPLYTFEICVHRDLGHDKWPDKIWDCNRRT